MKAVFVLACILAITVPFEAGSSSESKERRYFGRNCPPCPPCPELPDYPPGGQPPIIWSYYPPAPGAPADQPPAFLPVYPPFPGAPFPGAPFPGAPFPPPPPSG